MKEYVADFVSLSGLGLLGYGLFIYEPWISYSVCGCLLILFGVCMGMSEKPRSEP